MMCDTHCPFNLITVAGSLGHSGKKDGKAAQFSTHQLFQSGILFVCDSSNHCIRIIDIDIFVSRKRREDCPTAGKDSADGHAETGDTRQTEKTASVSTLTWHGEVVQTRSGRNATRLILDYWYCSQLFVFTRVSGFFFISVWMHIQLNTRAQLYEECITLSSRFKGVSHPGDSPFLF